MVYELYHGRTPFHHCKSEKELKKSVMQPLRINQFRPDLASDVRELIMLCLEVNDKSRPDMAELTQRSSYLRRVVGEREKEEPYKNGAAKHQHHLNVTSHITYHPKKNE